MSPLPARRFWWSAGSSAVVVSAFVAWILAGLGGVRVVTWMDALGELIAAGLAGVLCLWAAHRGDDLHRKSWLWLGASALAWTAGQTGWSWYQLIRGISVPFPSLGDVGFLAAVPFAVAAMVVFPTSPTAARPRVRMVLDGVIVAGSLIFISWATTLGAVYRRGDGGLLKQAIGLAYPLGDVVVGTVVLAALARAGRRDRTTLALIGAGLVALAVSDSAFAFLSQNNSFASGSVIDSGWAAGYVLIGLAALWSMTTAHGPARHQGGRGSTFQVLVPYLPLGLAGLTAAVKQATGGTFDGFLIADGLAVIAVVLARQLVTLLENVRLTQTLHVTVAQLRAREAELAHRAFHDPLTNLANRLLLADRVEHAMGRQRRTDESVAVLYCDLDGFKAVNDTLGHQAGDDVLVAVAERLSTCVRPGDTVARLGGDEFAMLLDGIAAPVDATYVAQRVVDVMRVPFRVAGRDLFVPTSVGVAVTGSYGDTSDLLRQADLVLYAAKDAGGNRYQVFASHLLDDPVDTAEVPATLRVTAEVGTVATNALGHT